MTCVPAQRNLLINFQGGNKNLEHLGYYGYNVKRILRRRKFGGDYVKKDAVLRLSSFNFILKKQMFKPFP